MFDVSAAFHKTDEVTCDDDDDDLQTTTSLTQQKNQHKERRYIDS